MTKSRSGFGRFSPVALIKRMTVVEWLVIFGIFFLIGSILLPSFQRWRQLQRSSTPCSLNFRFISAAIYNYSRDHGGMCPDRLEILIATQDITTECFVCPDSGDTRAAGGATTQEAVASFESGKHMSYLYLGRGCRLDKLGDDDVLVYEPAANHDFQGGAVLYGSGRINFLEPAALNREVNKTKAKLQAAATRRSR